MTSNRPVMSPAAFSGFLGNVVKTLAPFSEADPSGILGTLVSAFSAAVGSVPRVRVGYMAQPLPVWTVLIGNTGLGRKGTATGNTLAVMRAALSDWAERAVLEGCPQSGPALVSTLADMGGNALMVEEEFADLLKVSARYKSFGKAVRRLWESASVSNVTKAETIIVHAPHVAIIGNVTPAEFLGSIGKADRAGGTLNRFMALYVERSKMISLSEQISAQDWQELIRPLAQQMRAAVAFARDVEDVTPSREVVALWDGGMRDAVERLTIGNETMEQFAARATDYVWRISALYCLADRREEISVTDLRAAVALVEYMASTIAHLSPEAGNGGSMAVQVESFIRQAGETGVRTSELYKRFNVKKAQIDELLAGLITVHATKEYGAGRPTIRYRYAEATQVEPTMPEEMAQAVEPVHGVGPIGLTPTESVREVADVPETRPEELERLEAVMYGTSETQAEEGKPDAVAEILPTLPARPLAVEDLKATLDSQEECEGPNLTPVQETLTVEPDEDDDLSDLLANCTWAKVA